MARWFAKASMGKKSETAEPVVFELECDCGAVVRGLRESTFRRGICTACQTAYFILPRDPYPTVVPTPTRSSRPVQPVESEDEASELVRSTTRRKSSSGTIDRPAAPSDRSKGRAAVPPPISQAKGFPDSPPRRLVTPLRLGLALIFVTLLGAAWGIAGRYRLESARNQLQPAIDAGLAALEDGRFSEARRSLATAVRSLDVLGRTDNDAAMVRQRYRESVAAGDLLPTALIELIDESAGANDDVLATFERVHRGQWCLLDIPADNALTSDWSLEIPLKDGTRMARLSFSDQVGDSESPAATIGRSIVAAQLERIHRPDEPGHPLVFEFRRDSAFPWTSVTVYQHLMTGFSGEVDPPTRGVLEQQLARIQRAAEVP
ncbi:MAG: hypothetical protein KF777_01260 [Planctomycetaceae bacterium]|nr:hypothetical protein [Planctomycetaceae bacterium]